MKLEFHINEYHVDISKNQITNTKDDSDSAVINVPPKSLEVLKVLITNAPNVISVEEIMDTVWGSTVVSPNSVQRCIAQLRKALGDSSKLQKIIKTHAKKGYSLEATVSDINTKSQDSSEALLRPSDEAKAYGDDETVQREDSQQIQPEKASYDQEPSKDNDLPPNVEDPQTAKKHSIVEPQNISSDTPPSVTDRKHDLKGEQPVPVHSLQGHSDNLPPKQNWFVRLIRLRYFIIALILIILIISSFSFLPPSARNLDLNSLTPVLVSDAKETNATYAPDGQSIVFHRFDGLCANNIWVRDINTAREHQLTLSTGYYGPHQFTPNGNKLAFMAKDVCPRSTSTDSQMKQQVAVAPIKKYCWNLMTLDIEKALKEPQEPEIAISCNDGQLSNPVWLDNGNIAVLKQKQNNWQIVKYMPGALTEKALYSPNSLNIYYLGYLAQQKRLYILAINSKGEHIIETLDQSGQLQSSNTIKHDMSLSPFHMIKPFYDPFNDQLAFANGKQLYSLSLDGAINKLTQLRYNDLRNFAFDPTGRKLLATEGKVDLDVSETSFDELAQKHQPDFSPLASFNAVHQPYQSFARSSHTEYDAQFQPNGDLVAFLSDRTGETQLWLSNQNQLTQLTDFSSNTLITSFAWSPKGHSLIASVNGQVIEIDIDKTQVKLTTEFPITKIYQWTDDNSLLVEARLNGQLTLSKYTLDNRKLTVLLNKPVKWAQVSSTARLIYLDKFNQFWQHTISGPILIEKIANNMATKRFLLRNDEIWSLSTDDQLWQYNIKHQSISYIGQVSSQVSYFSDIRDNKVLLTQIISAKKDIVELRHDKGT